MTKGLEALEKLKNRPCLSTDWSKKEINYDYNKEEYDAIEKELKALEIIKEKKVNVKWLLNSYSCDDYNNWYDIHLTEEEYDLLKEVLL